MKFIAIIILAFLTGCSSIEVSHDYDQDTNFTKIKTYQWLPESMQSKPKTANFERKSPFLAKRIKRSIENNMLKKGLVIKDNKADAYITYRMKQNKKTMRQPKTKIGIGLGSVFNYGFGSVGFDLTPETETFQQGHLTIDIQDKNKNLLWQGKSTSPISEHPTPAETTELINDIIDKLLEEYPPK